MYPESTPEAVSPRDGPSGQPSAHVEHDLSELRRIITRQRRMDALRRTALLDSPAEESFDRLSRLTAKVLHVPISLVTLLDRDRQFFKSCVGLPAPWRDARQTPLTWSFCVHVVATGEPLVVEDARQHPVLKENLAVDGLGVVAYAGFPLKASGGEVLGTLCAIDTKPRVWTEEDLSILGDLAQSVMTEIELRATRELEAHARATEAARAEAEASRQRFALLAELSGALAEQTDLPRALTLAVRLSVPLVADGCILDLIHEDGRAQREAVAHMDPREEQRLRDVSEPPGIVSPGPGGRPSVAGHVRLGDPNGSSIRLALIGRDRVLGAITFLSVPPRRLGSTEAELARDVARRIALALDNARLHQELLAAIHTRDRFLSIASHELRTPLATLKLQLQGLLRGTREDPTCSGPRMTARADKISRQVERLGHLVEELLDVARVREGRMRFHLEDVDLLEVVREVAMRFQEELAHGGSRLVLRGEGDIRGQWDRLRLEQVVTNLLSNAIKYGQGHPILLTVSRDDGTARLTVRDEGIGIASGDQQRIFERFERAVSEQNYSGLGLGLWIVREILAGMSGTISVDSQPGQGATFTVELPRQAVPRQQPVLH
ncbi:GAF domain-containing protein [Pyxidicoccus fallax]|uniref:histidine kinase n=1 Tax=Pyxidicoccus fallax TaxID=394095 RepID=A0A848LR29_9BACT|nr:ATP-binding protein [Pyxidicoccus fallax]NMO20102.1 GAF domain-containing protein [Pyxidicoccus fallax]NPC82576.1 GAF domain-containing protein [Pyxidicoccus fallax]